LVRAGLAVADQITDAASHGERFAVAAVFDRRSGAVKPYWNIDILSVRQTGIPPVLLLLTTTKAAG